LLTLQQDDYQLNIKNTPIMAIDFVTYQLQSRSGKEFHHINGVLVEHAARTTHRHRQGDLLAMFISFSGDHRYLDDEISDLVSTASGIFFHTKGSVTRAIQCMIEDLNKRILDRNLDRGCEGVQADQTAKAISSKGHQAYLFGLGAGQSNDRRIISISGTAGNFSHYYESKKERWIQHWKINWWNQLFLVAWQFI